MMMCFYQLLHFIQIEKSIDLESHAQKLRKINTTHCEHEILSHQKNISSNQLFSNLFSKTVTFTKFLPKMSEREFP